jgi:hypothetical protein
MESEIMNRAIIKTTVGKELNLGDNYSEHSIDKLIDWLNNARANGATTVTISASEWSGSIEDISCEAHYDRLETEEECKIREIREMNQIRARKDAEESRERIMYEELKKKFEGQEP